MRVYNRGKENIKKLKNKVPRTRYLLGQLSSKNMFYCEITGTLTDYQTNELDRSLTEIAGWFRCSVPTISIICRRATNKVREHFKNDD